MKLWNQNNIDVHLEELSAIKDKVLISGGYAWHLMSPPHEETRDLHDHKDVDILVRPNDFQEVVVRLKDRGFQKVWTKYDGISKDFYRYTKFDDVKTIIDLFVEDAPSIEIDGFNIVEPKTLLSFYKSKHTSEYCIAVQAARRLVAEGIDPTMRKELIEQIK